MMIRELIEKKESAEKTKTENLHKEIEAELLQADQFEKDIATLALNKNGFSLLGGARALFEEMESRPKEYGDKFYVISGMLSVMPYTYQEIKESLDALIDVEEDDEKE